MAKIYTLDELKDIDNDFSKLINGSEHCYLILEKQVTSRRTVLNALKSGGIEREFILEAKSGKEALTLASRQSKPFIVIMDVNPQDMKGAEFIGKLRKEEGHTEDQVVIYTGETSKAQIAPVLKAGAKGFLRKPLSQEEFVKKLKDLDLLDE